MRIVYSFYFRMYMPSVLIGERVDVGKKKIFYFFIRMSEDGVGG